MIQLFFLQANNMIFYVGYPDELLNDTAVMEHYKTVSSFASVIQSTLLYCLKHFETYVTNFALIVHTEYSKMEIVYFFHIRDTQEMHIEKDLKI